ncbi:MAG: Holliday junction branch migration DNA helicase RuvB [Planctomycetota bacterium]
MAVERLISASTAVGIDDEQRNWALRPTTLTEYVGQQDFLHRLSIAVKASEGRDDPLEHILLHGPPGLGKTSLAHVIAKELGTNICVTSGPALARGTDLVATLTRLGPRDVLFIDEIHRLPIQVEEFIYPAMEDFRVEVTVDTGLAARTVQIRCKPFTLIGATTRAGLLSSPLRGRFGMTHHLRYYTPEELVAILSRACELLNITSVDSASLKLIASRSRGTPRVANRLLRRVRDFATVKAGGRVSTALVAEALALEGIDALGLDELDRSYLRAIGTVYRGGPVGLEAVAATMNEDSGTLEDVAEPYLLQIGFLARTRRGRALTKAAIDHLGLKCSPPDDVGGDLFD